MERDSWFVYGLRVYDLDGGFWMKEIVKFFDFIEFCYFCYFIVVVEYGSF